MSMYFSSVGFMRRVENRSTLLKISQSKDENQQQTQPTYDTESGNQTQATLVGGKCSHHCAIPAPLAETCFCATCATVLFCSDME